MTARVTFDFTGAQALITGGTSGIGYATATLFRDAGATVTVTGTKAGPDAYDTDLTGMTYRRLILTDPGSIDELVSTTTTLDVLVNNAGANFPGGLNEAEPDGFEASVALNLTAPYRLTVGLRKVLAASTTAGGASVVFLSSLSALRAVTMVPGYGAAKAGIASLTVIAAQELARYGVTVNAVAPGALTRMTKDLVRENGAVYGLDPAAPEDVAPLVVWLASPAARGITGRVFNAMGGVISVAEGWRAGPGVDKHARWEPAELDDVVSGLVDKARPNATMTGYAPGGAGQSATEPWQ